LSVSIRAENGRRAHLEVVHIVDLVEDDPLDVSDQVGALSKGM
jgi:hypothetical protein